MRIVNDDGPSAGPLILQRPEKLEAPILIEIPHAGLALPSEMSEAMRAAYALSDAPRKADADLYVDELYEGASELGATVLTARYSRHVVDLNRAEDDIHRSIVPDHPAPLGRFARGVIWKTTIDGERLLERPLLYDEYRDRILRFHRPYHRMIRAELHRLRERFGFAILIAAHSMPSHGRSISGGTLVRRADIVPGTRGRQSADPRIIDHIDAFFRGAGYSVRHDDPYRGGYSTGHYGRPAEGFHAVQIELNRGLYVDERSFERLQPGFDRLKSDLYTLVGSLCELRL